MYISANYFFSFGRFISRTRIAINGSTGAVISKRYQLASFKVHRNILDYQVLRAAQLHSNRPSKLHRQIFEAQKIHPLLRPESQHQTVSGCHMFHLCEADTILSFMKHEIPDNLVNMCCISLSVAALVSGKSQAFVWGLPGSQEVIAVGQWGTLIPWRRGTA